MNLSPLDTGNPPAVNPSPPPQTKRDQFRAMIGLASDSMTRALDMLARDDDADVVWGYVSQQMLLAAHLCKVVADDTKAIRFVTPGEDDDLDDTLLVPQNAGQLNLPRGGPYERGIK